MPRWNSRCGSPAKGAAAAALVAAVMAVSGCSGTPAPGDAHSPVATPAPCPVDCLAQTAQDAAWVPRLNDQARAIDWTEMAVGEAEELYGLNLDSVDTVAVVLIDIWPRNYLRWWEPGPGEPAERPPSHQELALAYNRPYTTTVGLHYADIAGERVETVDAVAVQSLEDWD